MVRWLRWHCPPDTGFEIRALAVWGRVRYLSVTEAPHNTNFHTWMGKKHFCFFQTAEPGNRTPNSGVKGSGANHYPRAPALQYDVSICRLQSRPFAVLSLIFMRIKHDHQSGSVMRLFGVRRSAVAVQLQTNYVIETNQSQEALRRMFWFSNIETLRSRRRTCHTQRPSTAAKTGHD